MNTYIVKTTSCDDNENEAQNDQFPLSTFLFCLIDLLGRRKQGIAWIVEGAI